ncbi:MAG: T9SS type A sorting domain-containing protein [Flavobacteriales bacterium]|nr:T9SS type A sorting domain-containing protein [Flavobacteriales bacterium]
MKRLILLPFAALLCITDTQAQCPPQQVQVTVELLTDNYGYETNWQLSYANGGIIASGGADPTYANATLYTQSFCVSAGACLRFEIFDTFGDGMCCGYGNGYYNIYIDGEVAATGGSFTNYRLEQFNCPPGTTCGTALPVEEGTHIAPATDTWYTFTPAENGTYGILACDNSCDTKIWVYGYCSGLVPAESNIATIYYDDDQGGCGPQAMLSTLLLEAGVQYWIRIGSNNGACTGAINWELVYNGPITGCIDPSACNYNPLATVQDGPCYFTGDPECPEGPDLVLNEEMLASSMYLSSLTTGSNDCRIDEGCLNGYGLRNVLRFSTHIYNIGNTDYYIGNPTLNPDQFSTINCHNHTHYVGYAEYKLYSATGVQIPIGFKNGFCVMDLECWSGGGTGQYGCSNMGISKQCGDIYDAGLDCQFIDITDVDTGLYTFVNTTNWDQSPDALGRQELNYMNNWAQVCIYIGRDDSGALYVEQRDECQPYTDCMGEIFGPAQPDCTGECGGSVLRGDLNVDSQHTVVDAQAYVSHILADDIDAQPCNDLNADDEIDVYDAALLNDCALTVDLHPTGSNHNHCNFPYGLTNTFETVELSIGAIDLSAQTIDIYIRNPDSEVVAYEFTVSGAQISNVTNLIDPVQYPIAPASVVGGDRVIGISYLDSLIDRNNIAVPLCRISYLALTDEEVCIGHIQSIVNGFYEETLTAITGECVASHVGVDELDNGGIDLSVFPNPFSDGATVRIVNRFSTQVSATVTDITGRMVRDLGNITSERVELGRGDLGAGVYFVQVMDSQRVLAREKVVVQ